MKLFEGENEAREYLEQRVPPEDEDRKADIAPLQEKLFDVPENCPQAILNLKEGMDSKYPLILSRQNTHSTVAMLSIIIF